MKDPIKIECEAGTISVLQDPDGEFDVGIAFPGVPYGDIVWLSKNQAKHLLNGVLEQLGMDVRIMALMRDEKAGIDYPYPGEVKR